MQLPNRHDQEGGNYRYGFQGQEKDDELKGEGNSVNYEFRMHDPRIGRFFAIDPLAAQYSYYSPYQFSGNRLIDCKELEGLEPLKVNPETGEKVISTINCHPKNDNPLSQVGEGLSPEAETTLNVVTDVIVITGGVIVTVASCGTGTPAYVAIVGVLSGSYATASGTAKLTVDLSGDKRLKELSENIPGSYLDATIGLTLEYSIDGKQYKDEVKVARSALNLAENLLTLDLSMFESLPKNATEMTDLSITVYSIGTGVNDLKTKIKGLNPEKKPEVKVNASKNLVQKVTSPAVYNFTRKFQNSGKNTQKEVKKSTSSKKGPKSNG